MGINEHLQDNIKQGRLDDLANKLFEDTGLERTTCYRCAEEVVKLAHIEQSDMGKADDE